MDHSDHSSGPLGKSDGFDVSFGHSGECRRTLPADSKRKGVWKMLHKPGRSPWDKVRKKRTGLLEQVAVDEYHRRTRIRVSFKTMIYEYGVVRLRQIAQYAQCAVTFLAKLT